MRRPRRPSPSVADHPSGSPRRPSAPPRHRRQPGDRLPSGHPARRPLGQNDRVTSRGDAAVALARSAHLGPTLVVTAVTLGLGIVVGADGFRVALLTAAMLLGQLSVGWSNDWLDAGADRAAGRTDKPAADGRIDPALLRTAAFVALVPALLLPLPASLPTALLHVVFVGSAWAYNLGLKRTPASVLPYIVSFGSLPALATLLLSPPAWPPFWATVRRSGARHRRPFRERPAGRRRGPRGGLAGPPPAARRPDRGIASPPWWCSRPPCSSGSACAARTRRARRARAHRRRSGRRARRRTAVEADPHGVPRGDGIRAAARRRPDRGGLRALTAHRAPAAVARLRLWRPNATGPATSPTPRRSSIRDPSRRPASSSPPPAACTPSAPGTPSATARTATACSSRSTGSPSRSRSTRRPAPPP